MSKNFLGIDIGGTITKVGLISKDGEIISFAEGDTPKSCGPEAEIGLIAEILDFLKITKNSLLAVGIGVPGPVDRDGIVHSPPNLNGWGDVAIGKIFGEYFQFPHDKIVVGNDANFAAMAEYRFGNGSLANPMVMLTLGTGVGGGVIIDGQPMLGKNGFAAELGHIIIDNEGPRCGCGRRGCAEALISHTGIIRTALNILKKDKGSLMWGMMQNGQFDKLTPKVVQDAADLGDPAANKVLQITANYLGIFLADLINIFNPEKIVIGGGISRWGDALLEPAKEVAKKSALKHLAKNVKIVRAKFSEKAGVLGAAATAIRDC